MCVNADNAIVIRNEINAEIKKKGYKATVELKNLETAEKIQVISGTKEVYGFIVEDLYVLVVLEKDCFGNKVVTRLIAERL